VAGGAKVIVAAVIIAAIVIGGSVYYAYRVRGGGKVSITICCAGSLGIPFNKLASIYTHKYGVGVKIETHGSVEVVRLVTSLGKVCDVVGVADYRLIPYYMVPKYASWYVAFATNQIVLVFTNKSKYASWVEKHPNEWYEVLGKPGVRYGFSNPDMDPCGYRAVGVLALASIYYHNSSILKDYVLSKISGSSAKMVNGKLNVYIPASFNVRGNLVMKPKEVDLVALLESGAIDYAFEYLSIAKQHHLLYVKLPTKINLSSPKEDSYYSQVIVHIMAGSSREKAITMKSIVYGVTVPKNAAHPKQALEFVQLLLSPTGRKVFEEEGQPFLEHPLGFGNVPAGLLQYVVTGKG